MRCTVNRDRNISRNFSKPSLYNYTREVFPGLYYYPKNNKSGNERQPNHSSCIDIDFILSNFGKQECTPTNTLRNVLMEQKHRILRMFRNIYQPIRYHHVRNEFHTWNIKHTPNMSVSMWNPVNVCALQWW